MKKRRLFIIVNIICIVFILPVLIRAEEKNAGNLTAGSHVTVTFVKDMEDTYRMYGILIDDWSVLSSRLYGNSVFWVDESSGTTVAASASGFNKAMYAPELFSTTVEATLTKSDAGGTGGLTSKASITGENEFDFFIMSTKPEKSEYKLKVSWGEDVKFESFWSNNNHAPAYEWSILGLNGQNLEYVDNITISETGGNYSWENIEPGEYTVIAMRGTVLDTMLLTVENIEITKFYERMLVEGEFDIEAKAAREKAGEKYKWSIEGMGKGEFKPNPSDKPKTKFAAKKITDPNTVSKLKVEYAGDKDEKNVKITKPKYAKLTDFNVDPGIRISKFIYSGSLELRSNEEEGKTLFYGDFDYRLLDQEKKGIDTSSWGEAWVFIKENLIKFKTLSTIDLTIQKEWDASLGGIGDGVHLENFKLSNIPEKNKKKLRIGLTVTELYLDWLATINKMEKHKEVLFNHGGFIKITDMYRDEVTGEINELNLGFGYRITGAL